MSSGSETFVWGLLGSLFAGLCTGLGALAIFVRPRFSQNGRAILLAVAAGVMLGATVFSLLLPAIDLARARYGDELQGVLVGSAGLLLGAVAIWAVHAITPHEHFIKGREGPRALDLGHHWLFIIAITIHNVPEGISVGVAYGAGREAGNTVALGIALQNLPEGLAVAAALMADGSTRARAFGLSLLTGMVEPLGGAFGAAAATFGQALLPWGLAFAAGAMLFVISGEIIPETHREGIERPATFALVLGFILMMVLDVTLS